METKANEPIRLTEGQTEMLTKALAEAAQQAAAPKADETNFITRPVAKADVAATPATSRAKKPMVL